tara:strand:+ start:87 stop:512 length:426 start_codon:yes stop_codon:yes gene_type:complete
MERITILINVKDRWLDNEEYDRYGDLIRWINPDPTVVWNSGCWDKELGQGVMMEMKASRFRELTGVIIYGGNVEKRGTHKLGILYGRYTRLKAFRTHGDSDPVVAKISARILPKKDKLTEAKEGRLSQLAGIKPRIRRKTK